MVESPIILLGIRDMPYLEAGIRNCPWDVECRKLRDYGIERKFAMGYPGWRTLFMRSFRFRHGYSCYYPWFRSSLYGNPLRRSCQRFCRPASDTKASRYTRDNLRSKRFRSSYRTKVRTSGWLWDDGIEGSIKTLCNSHNPAMFILYLFTWLFCSVRTLQGRLVRPKVPCVVWCKPNWLPHARQYLVSHLKTTACFNAITCLPFWEIFIRVM